jgi:SAM-dependent methyltransferase
MDTSKETDWFENWFDSKYYHILYGNRDNAEAERFMDKLIACLKPKPMCFMHDLCCGKGRHAVYLSHKGFRVTGSDLSCESIKYALQFENESLSFFVNDMRQVMRVNYFDYVFNLFTSFGYFAHPDDHNKVIAAVHTSLKPGGIFVLDYLNSEKSKKLMQAEGCIKAGGIEFHIKKRFEDKHFIKEIHFTDEGTGYRFREKVRAFTKEELEALFLKNGFELMHWKGNYELEEYTEASSDRMIAFVRKVSKP